MALMIADFVDGRDRPGKRAEWRVARKVWVRWS